MTDQCHDRGPHAYETVVLANTLLLGGEFIPMEGKHGPCGYWCVEWDNQYSTSNYGSKYRAGIAFLQQMGLYVTCEGNLERCP